MLICGIRFIEYSEGKKRYTTLIFARLILLIQILLDNKLYNDLFKQSKRRDTKMPVFGGGN